MLSFTPDFSIKKLSSIGFRKYTSSHKTFLSTKKKENISEHSGITQDQLPKHPCSCYVRCIWGHPLARFVSSARFDLCSRLALTSQTPDLELCNPFKKASEGWKVWKGRLWCTWQLYDWRKFKLVRQKMVTVEEVILLTLSLRLPDTCVHVMQTFHNYEII